MSSIVMQGLAFARLPADSRFDVLHMYGQSVAVLLLVGLVPGAPWSLASAGTAGVEAWTSHKNLFGYAVAFALVSALVTPRSHRPAANVPLLTRGIRVTVFAIALLASQSSGAVAAAVAAIVAYGLLSVPKCRLRGLPRAAIPIGMIVAAALTVNYEKLFNLFGRDPTATGRTTVWKEVLSTVGEGSFYGWGVGTHWRGLGIGGTLDVPSELTRRVWSATGEHFTSAHSSYLEALLVFGVPFGILIIWTMVSSGIALFRGASRYAPLAAFTLSSFVVESFLTTPLILFSGAAMFLLALEDKRV